MKPRELLNLGLPEGPLVRTALEAIERAKQAGQSAPEVRGTVRSVIEAPAEHVDDQIFGELASGLVPPERSTVFEPPERPAPWRMWGEGLDQNSIEQMQNAVQLPVAVQGALMPDAHLGYGLPIGGVLATDNAVIPYAVGVDIACRMKLTVLDLPINALRGESERLTKAIEEETRFGVGAQFRRKREHDVMDRDWSVTTLTRELKDKAWSQLGTSGSGNHFVEFGVFTIEQSDLGLEPGSYVALMSHSGSRGTGAAIASKYSKLAMELHPELPRHLKHLAWLDLYTNVGQEYWNAMNLMGEYAAANHAVIHREVARHLGAKVLADIENHHNFAWKETHEIDGARREVIVHRKGATPAGRGVLGVIPGSMASPAFVVRGRGDDASLHSASHGAGRVMSRTQAKSSITWSSVKKKLADEGVTLLSAGLDEAPFVYKDIHQVMEAQRDLVDVVARFDPKIVKMAPAGERAED